MTTVNETVRDAHYPRVHLRPPQHWVNDPNGLVHHDGRFHVYFQHNPYSARHEHMHWGHFRSRDLVHWELLPVALGPDPDGYDAGGVWSGNAVSLDDRLVAFFSARADETEHQPVAAAWSDDGGVTFRKSKDLLIGVAPVEATMFRDPYVWRNDASWRMVVGASLDDEVAAALHYRSEDLWTWEYVGHLLARRPEPVAGGLDSAEGWECTQFAEFDDGAAALLASAWSPGWGARGVVAFTGTETEDGFSAREARRLDHGPDFYAPALLQDPDGRWLMWGWIWEARDEERVGAPSRWTDEAGWAGMLSLPREITLDSDRRVVQRPARELAALRAAGSEQDSGPVSSDSEQLLTNLDGSSEVEASLGPGAALRIETAPGEHLSVRHEPDAGGVVVSRDEASLDDRPKGGSWTLPSPAEGVDLRVFLDRSAVEVFTAEGESLTCRFYPTGEPPWALRVLGGDRVDSSSRVRIWRLDPMPIIDLREEMHEGSGS